MKQNKHGLKFLIYVHSFEDIFNKIMFYVLLINSVQVGKKSTHGMSDTLQNVISFLGIVLIANLS